MSQWNQDTILNETYFKGKKGGIFVDVGAHDGKTFSNTYFFETSLGWTGLCIEPMAERFDQLQKNRPRSTCIYGCAYNYTGKLTFREVSGYAEMLSGVDSDYHPAHTSRIHREVSQHGGTVKLFEKPCYRLADLLEEAKISVVDYLTIDTEGSELKVLQGIDFDKVRIEVIDVENNYGDSSVRDFLLSKGFVWAQKIVGDDIYVRKST